MSVLREDRCYALSGGKLSGGGGNVSVFHVKLTDSAARAIGAFHSGKGGASLPTICFSGDYGRISVPASDGREDARTFTFGVTNVARDNPHGSFDCVQQLDSGASEELSCLGVIQKKMTVNATDDSYDKARQSMAQAEEETRSRGAIVIKHGGRNRGKRVTVRPPAPALASLSKPKRPAPALLTTARPGAGASRLKRGGAGAAHRKSVGDVQERPLRERVSHLLALRPYKRPELILRLQRDGLKAVDKDALDAVLLEVGHIHSRDNTFVLKDGLYKDLRKDWPGYTAGDQQLLKRILVRRLFQPQQNLLAVPGAQVSPLRDTPNSSPAHRGSRLPPPEEYTDPLASKRPRISHLSGKTGAAVVTGDRPRTRPREPQKGDAEAAPDEARRSSLDPQKLIDSLSAVCRQEAEVAQRGREDPREPEQAPPPLTAPTGLNGPSGKRKKSKHKEQEKERWKEKISPSPESQHGKITQDSTEPSENSFDSKVPEVDDDVPDYFLKYTSICSHGQRQSYKQDFNEEYSEYRDLHAHIDSVTQQFMELDTQLKRLHHGSHKYKTVRNQILQEYRKIKKSNPNYSQDKVRCEYLHNKLAHIKKLISDYDQQQLRVDHSRPN